MRSFTTAQFWTIWSLRTRIVDYWRSDHGTPWQDMVLRSPETQNTYKCSTNGCWTTEITVLLCSKSF